MAWQVTWEADRLVSRYIAGSTCQVVRKAGAEEKELRCDVVPPEVLELGQPCRSVPPGERGLGL